MISVKIKDIVEGLEMQFDESTAYLDKETGQVEIVTHQILSLAEEADDDETPDRLLKWQEHEYKIAQLIARTTGRFLRLPSKFDIHEWQIMEDFALSVENESLREELLTALHGRGAFRYFKDVMRRRGVKKEDWFEFRDKALRQVAVDWLEEHGVSYTEA